MDYPIGNKSAEKWNEQTTLPLLKEMLSFVKEGNVYSLSTILVKYDSHKDWWAYISKKFKDNENVYRAIKAIENGIENNIIHNTLDGTAKSGAMAIFLLKNKFGYKDKNETDLTTGGESINVINLGSGKKP